MRLSLGTAQFGLNYGIANNIGKINHEESVQIIKTASSAGIDYIDTAINYGDSEECIGNIGIQDFKITTKIPKIPSRIKNINKWVDAQISDSLKRLKQNDVYGIMLHEPLQLLDDNGKDLYDALLSLKKDKIVKKIGISVYSPNELNSIFRKFHFDIIQSPFNLIDNRLEKTGWLSKLSSEGVEIHTRSVFLQGVLLMSRENLPKFFMENWPNLFEKWLSWNENRNIRPIETCLAHVLSKPNIDRIVVGVDSLIQFKEILNLYNSVNLKDWPNIESEDEYLINPSNWYNSN